jgi:hypothetical protein
VRRAREALPPQPLRIRRPLLADLLRTPGPHDSEFAPDADAADRSPLRWHIERGEQGGGAMARVVVGFALESPWAKGRIGEFGRRRSGSSRPRTAPGLARVGR